MKLTIEGIGVFGVDDERHRSKVRMLIQTLRPHSEGEERELFARAGALLSLEALECLGKAMRRRKEDLAQSSIKRAWESLKPG